MSFSGYSEIEGSYKLSEKVIKRLVGRNIECPNESFCVSISNYELLAVLFFSQICNSSGIVEEIKITSLAEIIGCSRRAAYSIINNLSQKGFISIESSSWTGYHTIRILDNDFKDADYKTTRYLNTNFTYFNPLHKDYEAFKKLSLYAKKSLLMILFNYQAKYGYRVSLDNFMEYIGIYNKTKVMGYIDELRRMFDERLFIVYGSKKERLKYHNVYIKAQMPCFTADTGIDEKQFCYIKHQYLQHLKVQGISFSSLYTEEEPQIMKSLHKLYAMTLHYMSAGLSFSQIEQTIFDVIYQEGNVNEIAFYRIDHQLKHSQARCG